MKKMIKKVNIRDVIISFKSDYDFYVDLDSLNVIEEYDYISLDDNSKGNHILIPKYTYYQYVQMTKNFLRKKKYEKYKDILNRYIEEEIKVEKLYGIKNVEKSKRLMSSFHTMCEDFDIWNDFLDYEFESLKRRAIRWCEKYKLDYEFMEKETSIDERELENLVEKIITDKDRNNYYLNKYVGCNYVCKNKKIF